jgi:hypothetical protein
MMEVKDYRFEDGDWPMKFKIPVEQEQADRWPRYLRAECHRRGWASSGLGQLERAENSGDNRDHRKRQASTRYRMGTKA